MALDGNATCSFLGIGKIGLNQASMPIDKKKDAQKGSKSMIGGSQSSYMTLRKSRFLYQEIFIKPVGGSTVQGNRAITGEMSF